VTKPSDYPPVEDMSINTLRDIVLRLEEEEVNEYWNVHSKEAIHERVEEAVSKSILPPEVLHKTRPTNTYLMNRDMPNKQWQIAENKHTPLAPPSEIALLLFSAWLPMIAAWLLIALIALLDL